LDEILKDICRALLEADVNVRLVQGLRQNIKAQLDLEVLSKSTNKKRIIQRVN
jgi:signal recognition particle subunit SRP54